MNEARFTRYEPRSWACTHDEMVFFHELAHVAHERVLGALKGGQDWRQEIVAELTAATLAHLVGKRPNDGGAYRYIASYAEKAGKDVYRACLSVVADVEKCLALILRAVNAPSTLAAYRQKASSGAKMKGRSRLGSPLFS